MTLDPDAICIFGVPISGITAVRASSARQFVLGNGEFIALAGLYDEFAPLSLTDGARNGAAEMTVLQSVEEHLLKTGKSLANLRSARSADVILGLFISQCNCVLLHFSVSINFAGNACVGGVSCSAAARSGRLRERRWQVGSLR